MSVDFIVCSVCGEAFSECSPHWYCSNCEGKICVDCYSKEEELYGTIDISNKDLVAKYGSEALNSCSYCKIYIKANLEDSSDLKKTLDYLITYLLDTKQYTKEDLISIINIKRVLI